MGAIEALNDRSSPSRVLGRSVRSRAGAAAQVGSGQRLAEQRPRLAGKIPLRDNILQHFVLRFAQALRVCFDTLFSVSTLCYPRPPSGVAQQSVEIASEGSVPLRRSYGRGRV